MTTTTQTPKADPSQFHREHDAAMRAYEDAKARDDFDGMLKARDAMRAAFSNALKYNRLPGYDTGAR